MTKNKINQPPKFGTAHVNAEQRIKNETTCKNRKMEDIIEMSAMKKLKLINSVKYVNFEMQLLMLESSIWFLQILEH